MFYCYIEIFIVEIFKNIYSSYFFYLLHFYWSFHIIIISEVLPHTLYSEKNYYLNLKRARLKKYLKKRRKISVIDVLCAH